jgi:hypothetical protein
VITNDNFNARWRDDLKSLLLREFERFGGKRIGVLEAGGGSASFLKGIDGVFTFTTIDISPEQLDRNDYADERILGRFAVSSG